MELDNLSDDMASRPEVAPAFERIPCNTDNSCHEEHSHASLSRKRKEPNSASYFALKSILRERSKSSSAILEPSVLISRRTMPKRKVKFSLQDKTDDVRKWNGKRLRCLALDLDKRDHLPYYSPRHAANKLKTRQTKRLKTCHSYEDMGDLELTLKVDGQATMKCSNSDRQGYERMENLRTKTISEMKSIDKTVFVSRWLQHGTSGREAVGEEQHRHTASALRLFSAPVSRYLSPVDFQRLCPSAAAAAAVQPNRLSSSVLNLAVNFNTLSLRKALTRYD